MADIILAVALGILGLGQLSAFILFRRLSRDVSAAKKFAIASDTLSHAALVTSKGVEATTAQLGVRVTVVEERLENEVKEIKRILGEVSKKQDVAELKEDVRRMIEMAGRQIQEGQQVNIIDSVSPERDAYLGSRVNNRTKRLKAPGLKS